MPLSVTSICGFFFFWGVVVLVCLFVCFCLQCSIWGCNPRHCSCWASSLPLRYIPKSHSDLYFGIPNTPLIRYTQRRARLQRMRPVRSYSHALIQTKSYEGLSWAGYFYRVVSNDLGKIRKSEDSRKKIGFGLENCLDNRAIYLEGHYLGAIRRQEENQEIIVSHWGDSGQD